MRFGRLDWWSSLYSPLINISPFPRSQSQLDAFSLRFFLLQRPQTRLFDDLEICFRWLPLSGECPRSPCGGGFWLRFVRIWRFRLRDLLCRYLRLDLARHALPEEDRRPGDSGSPPEREHLSALISCKSCGRKLYIEASRSNIA